MSKIKQSLPEDVDITDPNEPAVPDQSESDDTGGAFAIDNAMYELMRAISMLEKNNPLGYEAELDEATDRLAKVYEKVRKPF